MTQRTTADLMRDFDEAVKDDFIACDESQCALIVQTKNGNNLIFHQEPDRQDRLDEMIAMGGVPLGFCKVYRIEKEITVAVKMVEEFKDNFEAKMIIHQLAKTIGKALASGDPKDGEQDPADGFRR